MTQNATQAKKSRSFTVGVSFRLSSYYSLLFSSFAESDLQANSVAFHAKPKRAQSKGYGFEETLLIMTR